MSIFASYPSWFPSPESTGVNGELQEDVEQGREASALRCMGQPVRAGSSVECHEKKRPAPSGLAVADYMRHFLSIGSLSRLKASAMASGPPAGWATHQESTTTILIPSSAEASGTPSVFINPVQEYNRDLSIAAIRAWSSIRHDEFVLSRSKKNLRVKPKDDSAKRALDNHTPLQPARDVQAEPATSKKARLEGPTNDQSNGQTSEPLLLPRPDNTPIEPQDMLSTLQKDEAASTVALDSGQIARKFTALEALSATGLRAIRYAKEIPSLKWIIANDLSESAVKNIEKNIAYNGLDTTKTDTHGRNTAKVRVNLGDACDLMYSHRKPTKQFDMVDLDPYGTAAPFMDAAVQCVTDGGLLCVTCTDLAVLAGSAYPEKCFANYGGTSLRAEYSHEYALRQVIHALASSAARYGRYIKPLLSLSIDFYVRIFVRVHASPVQVKKAMTQAALVYVCSNCSAHHLQPLGRSSTKPTKSGKGVNVSYGTSPGPPVPGSTCAECGGKFHVAGPIWAGLLHDEAFIDKVLQDVESSDCGLNTAPRIKGMVGIAKMELPNDLFFFTPAKLSGLFHCTSPPLTQVASALLNSGYQISRSHCQPGSIKTDAPRSFIHDVMRKWIEKNPVTMTNIKEGSPAHALLSKPITSDVSFNWNPEVEHKMQTQVKVIRYQNNPLPNWGPKTKAKTH